MVLDLILTILGVICLVAGLAGCILPFIPGPPVSYLGLLLISFTGFTDLSLRFLLIWAAVTAVVTLVDIYLPVWFTRRYGGSRAATIGSIVGLVVGLFVFPPFGIIFCPFLGALIGELLHDHANSVKALKVALGTFAAFMLGTGIKLIVCGVMLFYGIYALIPKSGF